MRRSSKGSQLINQSGQDEIYRFRCMQYLNFVLDQVVNQENRFKLYSSHIEVLLYKNQHLLRSNLNDITIQDIEKIKRMLDEGEKQKLQTQQTGDFINYDLIDKLKYSHNNTHYCIQQAAQESLLEYYGPNDYTVNEVQQIKNRHKLQKLNQNNFKMLDLMFKLPDDYQNLEERIQRQIQKQIQHFEQQGQSIMHQKYHNSKIEQENEILNNQNYHQHPIHPAPILNQFQKPILDQVDNKIQQNIKAKIQTLNQNLNFSTPQKQKDILPLSEGSLDIPFVQIKKKKSNKKKLYSEQKPINEVKIVQTKIKSQQPLVKQDKDQQNRNPIQNDQGPNILTVSPQKKKYIRKKPVQYKKQKSEKSKSGEKELQNKWSQMMENKLQLEGEIKQSNNSIGKQSMSPKKSWEQKEKRSKKLKKVDSQGKRVCGQELQIVLPYPQCEQQVKQLKKQLQELNKRLQNQKQQFLQNRQHALNLLTIIQSGQNDQIGMNSVNELIGKDECGQDGQGGQKIIHSNDCSQKINNDKGSENERVQFVQEQDKGLKYIGSNQQKQEIKVHGQNINHSEIGIILEPKQEQHQQQQSIITQKKKKSNKIGGKLNVLKKQSKKSSSEEYKPPEDELESVYEIEKDGKLVLVDQNCDKKKAKKQKKKYAQKTLNLKNNNHKSKKTTENNNHQENYNSSAKKQHLPVSFQQTIKNQQPLQPIIDINHQTINNNSIPHIETLNTNLFHQSNQQLQQPLQTKEKKSKLTIQQRQHIKQQKEKLKQMKLKQKQQKKKLKELQKLQKETLKFTRKISQKSFKSNQQPKAKQHRQLKDKQLKAKQLKAKQHRQMKSKQHKQLKTASTTNKPFNSNLVLQSALILNNSNNNICIPKSSNVIEEINNNEVNLHISNGDKRQVSFINDNHDFQLLTEINNKNALGQQDQYVSVIKKQKNVLDESIGMNSTKEEIKADCIGRGEENNSMIIEEEQQRKTIQQYLKSQSIEFAAILNAQATDKKKDQQQSSGLKRAQPISYENKKEGQQDLMIENPKKRIKLQCKESMQYEDPHNGIQQPNNPNSKYLIQVFHINQSSSNSPQLQPQKHNQIIEQQLFPHLASHQQQANVGINQNINQQQVKDKSRSLLYDNL